uniref:Uncharacterized protein LOC111100387 n=1 Tax=Crassostrea virginica TaxID=6565 RepID=A0A8B8A8W7_CRAVI|nr:uncharacterized protein LOC111100387 [Crassostrea virginica]
MKLDTTDKMGRGSIGFLYTKITGISGVICHLGVSIWSTKTEVIGQAVKEYESYTRWPVQGRRYKPKFSGWSSYFGSGLKTPKRVALSWRSSISFNQSNQRNGKK